MNNCWYWLALAIRIERLDAWYPYRHGCQPVLEFVGGALTREEHS